VGIWRWLLTRDDAIRNTLQATLIREGIAKPRLHGGITQVQAILKQPPRALNHVMSR